MHFSLGTTMNLNKIILVIMTTVFFGCSWVPRAQTNSSNSFYYIYDNRIFKESNGVQSTIATSVYPINSIKYALIDKQSVYLLTDKGIQKLAINNGSVTSLLSFDTTVLYGNLLNGSNGTLIYWACFNSTESESGIKTDIGLINLETDSATHIITLQQSAKALGMTNNQLGIYVTPIGQNPEHDTIHLIDFMNNYDKPITIKPFFVVDIDSESKYIITSGYDYNADNEKPQSVIRLYTINGNVDQLWEYQLSQDSNNIPEVLWAPDDSNIYYLVSKIGEASSNITRSVLWRISLDGKNVNKVADIENTTPVHLFGITSDGKWLLLQSETPDTALETNIVDGTTRTIKFPGLSLLIQW